MSSRCKRFLPATCEGSSHIISHGGCGPSRSTPIALLTPSSLQSHLQGLPLTSTCTFRLRRDRKAGVGMVLRALNLRSRIYRHMEQAQMCTLLEE
ncbi:hypothetical protein AAFF_G00437820 [Aldrovandia affinis]|uniref:Uncharacterized protein n=1 Tax=Aldrovandia affinis TaxID=143900 RepID=A0AAD7SA00_9TELE|nr:hypothetical protein AAFF_G00437820 [Aldrovandia affinis]